MGLKSKTGNMERLKLGRIENKTTFLGASEIAIKTKVYSVQIARLLGGNQKNFRN